MTKQAFKDECDINNIVRRNADGQAVTHLNPNTPQYGDFANVDDYQTAIHAVRAAEEQFAALPALIRERMANDPANLVAFAQDPNNLDEAVKLGLIPAPEEPQAQTVPISSPPEPETPTPDTEE